MDFTEVVEPHRRELRVHCYRLTGSYDEAEDLVQETFLKAWRKWDDFAGRSSVRTWLFRIATNTCLGWPAADTADALDLGVAAANSALQRGRVTLREHLPARRADWAATTPTEAERAVLRRYMDAVERADLGAVAALLAEDVRSTMPPYPEWFAGRDATLDALARSWNPDAPEFVGRLATAEVRANTGPAAAVWTTLDGRTYRAFAIGLIRVEGDRIAGMTAFHDPHLFEVFGLPMTFPAGDRLPG